MAKVRKTKRVTKLPEQVFQAQEEIAPQVEEEVIESVSVVEVVSKPKKFPFKKVSLLVCLVLIFLGLVGGAIYLYQAKPKTSADQAQLVVSSVSKLMVLPVGETPTIATVTDVSKLSNQPFFEQAQNGDKVLIYQKAQKAILYDPTVNKIVNVGPITMPSTPPTAQVSSTPSATLAPVRLALLNGTTITGYAKSAEVTINAAISSAKVVKRANAAVQTYKKTEVVDVTGKNAQAAQQIANVLHGEVGALPPTEQTPDADIVVILGSNSSVTPTH